MDVGPRDPGSGANGGPHRSACSVEEMSPEAAAPNRVARSALGMVIVAGGVGVVLRLVGVHSAATSALVLLFLAVAPTVAVYGLLHSFDSFARIILAGTVNVVFLTLLATVMLTEGIWSPVGGLWAVTGITLACLLAQWPPVSRLVARVTATRRSTSRAAEL